MYYPCRVLGVGPSSPSHAAVCYLGYGTFDEVSPTNNIPLFCNYQLQIERSSGLVEIPLDRLEEVGTDRLFYCQALLFATFWQVQQIVYHEAIAKTCGYGDHSKYYDQRYRLFSRYDNGIMLDDESWFSVSQFV